MTSHYAGLGVAALAPASSIEARSSMAMNQSCSFFLGIRSAAECGFPDFTFCLPVNSQLCGRGEIDEVYGTA